MIKNIIFDMGQVLLKFEPILFIERLSIFNNEDQEILLKEIYHSQEWVMMDKGTLTINEAIDIFKQKVPEHLKQYVYDLVDNWYEPRIPVEGMLELVEELSKKYNLFLLSNASENQPKYWNKTEFAKYFKDTLISCDVHVIKPNKEIYELAIKKFNIKPNESIFIDDNKDNVQGAINSGINAIQFIDANKLKEELKEYC